MECLHRVRDATQASGSAVSTRAAASTPSTLLIGTVSACHGALGLLGVG